MSTPTDQWKKSDGEDGRINVVGVQGKKRGRRWKRKGKPKGYYEAPPMTN